jgi:hypothetical protein
VLPEVAPEPEVEPLLLVPYFCTQSWRSVPTRLRHWLGTFSMSADWPVVPEVPLPDVPLPGPLELPMPLEPEEAPVPPLPLPEAPPAPPDCAHVTLATPSNAAATAAVMVFICI